MIMFKRICEICEPLEATIPVLQKPVETLTTDEWLTLQEACEILHPFELVTTEISSEQSMTVSKIIVLVRGLMRAACQTVRAKATTTGAQQVIKMISEELDRRFANCEMNTTLARATFLDSRFKKFGFFSDAAFTSVRDKVTTALANAVAANDSDGACRSEVAQAADVSSSEIAEHSKDDELVWGAFDQRVSSVLVTPSSSAIIEVRQYVEEPHIARHGDPLLWWKERHVLPRWRDSTFASLLRRCRARESSLTVDNSLPKDVYVLSQKTLKSSDKL